MNTLHCHLALCTNHKAICRHIPQDRSSQPLIFVQLIKI